MQKSENLNTIQTKLIGAKNCSKKGLEEDIEELKSKVSELKRKLAEVKVHRQQLQKELNDEQEARQLTEEMYKDIRQDPQTIHDEYVQVSASCIIEDTSENGLSCDSSPLLEIS